jgi:hypothetical protein
MLSAYVLIQTEVGKVAHVAQASSLFDGHRYRYDRAKDGTRLPRPPPGRADPHDRPSSRLQGWCSASTQ